MSINPTNERERLAELRKKITQAQTKRRTLESTPRTKAEALSLIDEHVSLMAGGSANHPIAPHRVDRAASPGFVPGIHAMTNFEGRDLESALCAIAPDLMKAYLRSELEAAMCDAPQGITSESRAKGLSKLDNEIRSLEIEEERLICEFESAGLQVARRGDCSIEVFLEVVDHETNEAA